MQKLHNVGVVIMEEVGVEAAVEVAMSADSRRIGPTLSYISTLYVLGKL